VKAGGREEERLAREAVAKIRTWAVKRKRTVGVDSLPSLAIKFCGGCNPVIDRGQVARSIRDHLTGLVRWVPPEEVVDLLLIISGCPTACVDRPEVTKKAAEYFTIAGSEVVFIKTNPDKEKR